MKENKQENIKVRITPKEKERIVEYCEAHNIRLFKIPYYDYKIINCEYLSKLLLLPNKA